MIFNLNMEVDLTEEEIFFLRKYFLEDRKRSINSIFIYIESKPSKNELGPIGWKNTIKSLIKKHIIIEDNIQNCSLTDVGLKLVDILDRDKKLGEILDS